METQASNLGDSLFLPVATTFAWPFFGFSLNAGRWEVDVGRASKRERKSYNGGRFILLRTAEKWSKSRRASKKPARNKRGGGTTDGGHPKIGGGGRGGS